MKNFEPEDSGPSLFERILFFFYGEKVMKAPCERFIDKFKCCYNTKNYKNGNYIFPNLCSICQYKHSYGKKYYCKKAVTKHTMRLLFSKPKKAKEKHEIAPAKHIIPMSIKLSISATSIPTSRPTYP